MASISNFVSFFSFLNVEKNRIANFYFFFCRCMLIWRNLSEFHCEFSSEFCFKGFIHSFWYWNLKKVLKNLKFFQALKLSQKSFVIFLYFLFNLCAKLFLCFFFFFASADTFKNWPILELWTLSLVTMVSDQSSEMWLWVRFEERICIFQSFEAEISVFFSRIFWNRINLGENWETII